MSNLRRADAARLNVYFEALKKCKEHDDDGKLTEKRPGLGTWVKSQRTSFRSGKMNAWRSQMLNSVGFVWRVTGEACSPQFGSGDDDTHNIATRQKKANTRVPRRARRLGRKRSKNHVTHEEETAFVADGYGDEDDEDDDDDDIEDFDYEIGSGFPWWSPDESVCNYASLTKPVESAAEGTSLQQEDTELQALKNENSDQKETIQSLKDENATLRRWQTRRPPRPKGARIQGELAVLQSEVDALSTQQSKLVALGGDLASLSRFHDEHQNQAKIEKLRAELRSLL
jgi:Helicase associated domain